jgi:nicotinate-nucleotide adenylyltransferase
VNPVRWGLLGGSFDPIHAGHIHAAETALRIRGLAKVLLIPAASPPHKRQGCRASFEDRVEMARLAADGHPGLEVAALEGERNGPSYTVDTVEAIRARHSEIELDLLVGADMLADFPNWRRAAELVELVTIVAFERPGEELDDAVDRFAATFGRDRLVLVALDPVDTSATELRRALAEGAEMGPELSPEVHRYIRVKRLYESSFGG